MNEPRSLAPKRQTPQDTIDASAFTGSAILSTGGGADTLAGASEATLYRLDVGGLAAGDQVKIDASAGGDHAIVVQGLTTVGPDDLGWVDIIEGVASTTLTSDGLLTVTGDLLTNGLDIKLAAKTIDVDGHTINSGLGDLAAGDITLRARDIHIYNGAKLLARNDAGDGNIAIAAIDNNNDINGLGLVSVDRNEASVVIGRAEISGGTVEITAKAKIEKLATNPLPTEVSDALTIATGEKIPTDLQAFLDMIAVNVAIVVATAIATVDIQQAAEITAGSVVIDATADNVAKPKTKKAYLFAALAGAVRTTARVTVAGEITTETGDLTLTSLASNTAVVTASPSVYNGIGVAVAVTVIDSSSEVLVTKDATLDVANDLKVRAETIDIMRTYAKATTGADGRIAIAIGVSVQLGSTSAYLDGAVEAGGIDRSRCTAQRSSNLWYHQADQHHGHAARQAHPEDSLHQEDRDPDRCFWRASLCFDRRPNPGQHSRQCVEHGERRIQVGDIRQDRRRHQGERIEADH